jgi:LmbE family N-acetylglucosaminyl deacetylase
MNKVLVIVAHADDEAIGCGGTLLKHRNNNDKIQIIYMTNGVSARSPIANAAEKSEINKRAKAQQKACQFLAVNKYHHYDFPDNKMDQVPLIEVTKQIEKVITEFQPSLIYTHHGGDLNVDHRIVHQAVLTACRPQPTCTVKTILTFEVNSSTEWSSAAIGNEFIPNYFVDISDVVEEKNKLLGCYVQEMREYPHSRSVQAINNINQWRGNQVGLAHAEAFMLIRKII